MRRTLPILVRALGVFAVLGLVLLLVGLAVYRDRVRADRSLLQRQQQQLVRLTAEALPPVLDQAVTDLRVLVAAPALGSILAGRDDAGHGALAPLFEAFLREKAIYDQVRFLDTWGEERVRVDRRLGRVSTVPSGDLQAKGARYYVAGTLKLGPGRVFVSPFDLNVEHGQVERPEKPTIRFAAPVIGDGGRVHGIVVLNLLGARITAAIERFARLAPGALWLLDGRGRWLRGPHPVTVGRGGFAETYPAVWRVMSATDSGEVEGDAGLTAYHSFVPVPAARDAEGYPWIVVAHANAALVAARHAELRAALFEVAWWLAVILLGVAGVVAWLLDRNELVRGRLVQHERLAAIGEAVAGMAHESRNALQRSRAAIDLLARPVADPDELELLGELARAHADLQQLYDSVRRYAAPVVLEREQADVGEVLHRVWTDTVGESGRLVEHAGDADRRCRVDRHAMGQVLHNVLHNALLARPEALEVVVAWSDVHLSGSPALRISITDNGPGLTARERSRIFEPFFTTRSRGTGLGMAIARRIVESHGGRIVVGEGREGGAEVVIVLPR